MATTGRTWHRIRKRIHLACFAIFLTLPFLNVMRFDIPRQRFYFAGQELWINEFGIIFFALMFLMFVIAAASMLYGRIFCGYACPQMIFSEASLWVEERLRKLVNKRLAGRSRKARERLARTLFYGVVWVCSTFLAFAFISYFVEPKDLARRLLALDLTTAGGIAGAVTTLITFLDFTLVRQRFCTTVCPYGYLQGILADRNTLLVEYRDGAGSNKVCIECKKCVRVCHMGIDIRDSAHQIECIHCGECIDACDDVLGRLGKPGLIFYSWGEQGNSSAKLSKPWYWRWGFQDGKRFALLLVLLLFASGLFVALSMRNPVLVRISPLRSEQLYRIGPGGEVYNRFRVSVANRSQTPAAVDLQAEGLSGARLTLPSGALVLEPGAAQELEFEVAARPGDIRPGVNHFRFVARSGADKLEDRIEMTFIAPERP